QEKENRLSDIQIKIARANLQLNSKLNALPLWQGNADSFLQIQIPSKGLVENTEQDLRNAISDLKSVEQEFNNLQFDVKRRETSISTKRKQLTLSSLEDLVLARQERDQAWAEIDSLWRQSIDLAAHEKSNRSDTFVQLTKQADRMADQLRDHAELVAEMLELEILRAQQEITQAKLQQCQNLYSVSLERFQKPWEFLLDKPVDPSVVKPWLSISQDFETLSLEIATAESEIMNIQSDWPEYLKRIAGDSIAQLFLHCQTSELAIGILTEKQISLESLKSLEITNRNNIKSKTEEIESRIKEKEEIMQRLNEQMKTWQTGLQQNKIDEKITPDYFAEFFANLNQFHLENQKYQQDIHNRQNLSNEIEIFDVSVHRIASELGFQEDPESTIQTIRRINKVLGTEREKKEEINRLNHEIDRDKAKIIKLKADAAEDKLKVEQICRQIGVATEELAEDQFRMIFRKNEIESKINQKLELLFPLRGEIDLETWIDTVEAETEEEALSAKEKLEIKSNEKEHHIIELLKKLGELEQHEKDIRKRVGEARSFDVRNDQSLLIESTDRNIKTYLKNAITNRILEEATQDYRRRMGDDVLNMACHNFKKLSLDSFDGIRPVPNESGGNKLVAVRQMDNPDSDELELNELSEGTRDQLFLALQLTMIQNRLEDRAKNNQCPLPVIFDDILVQFDDERAKAAFGLFQALAQKTQVIFLTHHDHREGLANQALGQGTFGVSRLGQSLPTPEYELKTEPKRRRKGDKPTGE
ncbi:MAG: ATP-binding protein, partial [bacterium]